MTKPTRTCRLAVGREALELLHDPRSRLLRSELRLVELPTSPTQPFAQLRVRDRAQRLTREPGRIRQEHVLAVHELWDPEPVRLVRHDAAPVRERAQDPDAGASL